MNTPWPLADNSVDCCVTSPPYWALRNYGVEGQLGLEPTPDAFINNMVKVFEEVRRVLKPRGTLWINIGDSYSTGGRGNGGLGRAKEGLGWRSAPAGYKHKDLVGIPWMLAFALRSAGWYLRQDIIWHKPNPMPESAQDRCTKAHEYIFLLTKSPKYYFDQQAIKEPLRSASVQRLAQNIDAQNGSDRVPGKTNGAMKAVGGSKHKVLSGDGKVHSMHRTRNESGHDFIAEDGMANKKSVWNVATSRFKDAHFATFPEELITPCILAGCPKGGIVLDPFMGAGTTALVAMSHGRHFTGFELNPEYIRIANNRLKDKFGMFYNP